MVAAATPKASAWLHPCGSAPRKGCTDADGDAINPCLIPSPSLCVAGTKLITR